MPLNPPHGPQRLFGNFDKCESCTIAKIRAKPILRANLPDKIAKPGELLCFDTSSVQTPSNGGSKFWLLVIDDSTSRIWSFFMKAKSDTGLFMTKLVKALILKKVHVQRLRCDNAKENRAFADRASLNGLAVDFEFTSPYTPQQNGKVERAYPTLYGRARAMMLAAGIPQTSRGRFWAEAANTATDLANIMSKGDEDSPYQKFHGIPSSYENKLRTFGKLCVVADRTPIKAKLQNRGYIAMFLGYSKEHPADCYRLYKFTTKQVIESRDVQWLGRMFGSYEGFQPTTNEVGEWHARSPGPSIIYAPGPTQAPTEENFLPPPTQVQPPEPNITPEAHNVRDVEPPGVFYDVQHVETPEIIKDPRLPIAFRTRGRKRQFYNAIGAVCFLGMMGKGSNLDFKVDPNDDAYEPTTYEQAITCPRRLRWLASIAEEFNAMDTRVAWEEVDRELARGRRLVTCRWVFKVKSCGRYRARLVAKGFSQVPGIDFTESYGPVVTDIGLRILITIVVRVPHYVARQMDVDTAFLYGDLCEEIFMELPPGYTPAAPGRCLRLKKCIYGLIQASREWYKKFINFLKHELHFTQSADPCILYRTDETGTCYLCVYINDTLLIGDLAAVNKAGQEIANRFSVKLQDTVTENLGCEFFRTKETDNLWIGQPRLISSLAQILKEEGHTARKTSLPAIPWQILPQATKASELLSADLHRLYQRIVGKLLYLTTKTRPDIANAVRDLTKHLDAPMEEHLKAARRLVSFVTSTHDQFLAITPEPVDTYVEAYCDSDFAGDPDTRRSVTGFVIFFCGVAVAWRSKAQKLVTLSSSEAEYVALTDCIKDIIFVRNLLQSIQWKIQGPIVVHVDNIGAIFIANNFSAEGRTKHIDTHLNFIRDLIEHEIVTIKYVRSHDNVADIFTKNVDGATFDRHKTRFVCELTGEVLALTTTPH